MAQENRTSREIDRKPEFPQESMRLRISRDPYQFEFFQAVRLICREGGLPLGEDHPPEAEAVRFRTLASLSFPPSEITECGPRSGASSDSTSMSADMEVPFFGLTGPQGVLPRHYTQLVIDRSRQRDTALRDFLDLFNHRLLALFYRAWEKPRLPVRFERAGRPDTTNPRDLVTICLESLLGLGTGGLGGRLDIDDAVLVYFGGHYSQDIPRAVCLEAMLIEQFHLPANVIQLVGQWLYLAQGDQTRLSAGRTRVDLKNQLGQSAVVGDRVWGVENKFRVQLGPLDYSTFVGLLPNGSEHRPLGQFVRRYVGPEYDFELQLLLLAEHVPCTRLGDAAGGGSRLGWNTWIQGLQRETDAEDAVFAVEGMPTR